MSGLDTTPSPEHAALNGSTIDPNSILSGATAQTSGFAQAGPPVESGLSSGFGGGLASSPNVPAPGTSIDSSTGLPHVAGLTRAELEANKAQSSAAVTSGFGGGGLASSPNVPIPGTTINPETGKLHTAGLTRAELEAKKAAAAAAESHELSGREQAARQLAGVGATSSVVGEEKELSGAEQAARQLAGLSVQGNVPVAASGLITPGQELPGGWGPVKPVAAPGTGPHATTSIYEDVAGGLEKVGNAAYAAIPSPIKDALSSHHTTVAGTNTTTGRRGSAAAIFEQAKNQAIQVVHQVEEKLANTSRGDLHPKLAAGRTAGTAGSEGSVLSQVKGLFGGIVAGTTTHGATAVAPATSLPSNETAGALPGAQSSGAGALPGAAGDTGVAVLPLEKENQHILPGEVPVREGNLDSSASPSIVPTATTQSTSAPAITSAPTTGTGYSALAPALPQTNLGLGADKGATDVGLEKSSLTPQHEAAAAAVTGGAIGLGAGAGTAAVLAHHSVGSEISSGNALDTRHSADRTTSTASVTAIRGGHEGSTHVPGPEVDSLAAVGEGKTVQGGGGAVSLTPGNEVHGVGHPSTRGAEGTSRQPGTYPAVDHEAPHSSVDGAANHNVKPDSSLATSTSTPAAAATAPSATKSTEKPFPNTTDQTIGIPPTVKATGGVTGTGHSDNLPSSSLGATSTPVEKGHERTGSNASEKKKGLFSKIKEKIKHHN